MTRTIPRAMYGMWGAIAAAIVVLLAIQPAFAKPKSGATLKPAARAIDPESFDHNRAGVGFALDGQHAQLPCESCHKQRGVYTGAAPSCAGCHKPPRHGDFGACTKCHNTTSWIATSFAHDKTAFPLDGRHVFNINAPCEACHATLKPGDFQKANRACTLCHQDPHAGKWKPTPCATCHTATSWSSTLIDGARHESLFHAPLKGAHAGVPCASCHTDKRPGAAPRGKLPTTNCVACHANTHGTMFAGQSCESCHDESSWRHVPGFDHTKAVVDCATCHKAKHGDTYGKNCSACHDTKRWDKTKPFDHQQTMFALDRRHRAVACIACHDPKKPRVDARCGTCHDDPHRGRAQRECEDCHRGDRWTLIRWDHDRGMFPLRGRHFATPCRDCHTNDEFTGLRSECIACHRGDMARANAQEMSHRTYSFDCAACHKPFKW